MIVVFATASSTEEANSLANSIIAEGLAACVQIIPGMRSVYMWKGEISRDEEHLLLIKTKADLFEPLKLHILANHSYDVPEIVALPAERVSESYAAWLDSSLATSAE